MAEWEWAWVATGYSITFVALAGYLISIALRARRVRRHREELR